MSPIYDYACKKCGIFESIERISDTWTNCPTCGKYSNRIISMGKSAVNTANEDALHVRQSAAALLNKETAAKDPRPHVRDLANHPTRTNLKRYLKAEGLRYAENEGGAPPRYRKPEGRDRGQIAKELYEKHRERNAIEVRP